MTNAQNSGEAERIAKVVADRCHGTRKPGTSPQRYATIWQAARLGALEVLSATPAPSDQAGWQEAVKEHLTTEVLDEATKLEVVRWEGRIHCAYLNDFRVAGGKPWAGGTTEKSWGVTLRDVIRAFPALQKALGFNYLGQPLPTAPTLTAGEGGE